MPMIVMGALYLRLKERFKLKVDGMDDGRCNVNNDVKCQLGVKDFLKERLLSAARLRDPLQVRILR
jgi:hypothetical protein